MILFDIFCPCPYIIIYTQFDDFVIIMHKDIKHFRAVYEFEGPINARDSPEGQNIYGNMSPADRLRLVTVRKVPVKLAKGHTYLLGQ